MHSPFNIQLGDVAFDLYAEDVYLGRGFGYGVGINAMGPSNVSLNGTLIPHLNDSHALSVLGTVFSAYISGDSTPVTAVGVYTRQPGTGENIGWLNAGIEALRIGVPLKAPTPINPIKSIDIGYMNLTFSEAEEWAPITNTNNITAELGEPCFPFLVFWTFGIDVF
jgi:hypothetical protein